MTPVAVLPADAMVAVGAVADPDNVTVVAAVVPRAGTAAGKTKALSTTVLTTAAAAATAAGVSALIVAVVLAAATCGAGLPPQAASVAATVTVIKVRIENEELDMKPPLIKWTAAQTWLSLYMLLH